MKKYKGKLITFEGSEGSGKSTQIALALAYLRKHGFPVILLREPGGVKISEKIRDILLDNRNKGMSSETETLLYMAARAQLVEEVIVPRLKEGKVILCDRFLDSTLAYQGYGCGVDIKFIQSVGKVATRGVEPDLTFIFDIDSGTGLSRIKRKKDRIEERALDYHNRVRKGYQALARKHARRIRLIKVTDGISKEDVHALVLKSLNKLFQIS